jgi:hypothetical protein
MNTTLWSVGIISVNEVRKETVKMVWPCEKLIGEGYQERYCN